MTPSTAEKAERFRELHGSGCFVMANAWDMGSARLLQSRGFAALGTTSAGLAWSMGQKDGATSRDIVLANARDIVDAVDVPVSGDLLNGFGAAPEAVAETIRLAGEAGLAGASIEDTTGDPGEPLFDRTLARGRILAAVEAARALPHPFVLCARADGLFAGTCELGEILARLDLYQEAVWRLPWPPELARRTAWPEGDRGLTCREVAARSTSRSSRPRWALAASPGAMTRSSPRACRVRAPPTPPAIWPRGPARPRATRRPRSGAPSRR